MSSQGQELNIVSEEYSCSDEDSVTTSLDPFHLTGEFMDAVPHTSTTNAIDNRTIVFGNIIYEKQGPPPELINWDTLFDQEADNVVERQIIQVLQKETTENPNLIGALQTLVHLSEKFTSPKPNVLQLIFQVIQKYPKDLPIQIASIEAIYALKSHLSSTFYDEVREKIVNETLSIAKRFSNDDIINSFAALIINDLWQCFHIEKIKPSAGISFAMQVLCNFVDRSIQKPCLQFLSKMVGIPGNHLSEIERNKSFWEKIFNLVEERYKAKIADEELVTCLAILKTLSYEIPIRYRIIYESKLDLVIQLIDRFPNNQNVLSKALSILEQVSRQEEGVRLVAMQPFIKSLLPLTKSKDMRVNYLASSVLFNIFINEEASLLFDKELTQRVHLSIESAVYKWGSVNQSEIVKQNSLQMLIQALDCNKELGLQLFSAWTLNYLWSINPDQYTSLIKKENLLEELQHCPLLTDGCEEVKSYLNSVLQLATKTKKGSDSRNHQMSLLNIFYALKNPNVTIDEIVKFHESVSSQLSSVVMPNLDEFITRVLPKRTRPEIVTMLSAIFRTVLSSNSPPRRSFSRLKTVLYLVSLLPLLRDPSTTLKDSLKFYIDILRQNKCPDKMNNAVTQMMVTVNAADHQKHEVRHYIDTCKYSNPWILDVVDNVLSELDEETLMKLTGNIRDLISD